MGSDIAEDNFRWLISQFFNSDVYESSNSKINLEGESLISITFGTEDYDAVLEKAFGEYATNECVLSIMTNQYFNVLSGNIDEIVLELTEDKLTDFIMTISLTDDEQQEHSFEIKGSFHYERDGKLTFFQVEKNKALDKFILNK